MSVRAPPGNRQLLHPSKLICRYLYLKHEIDALPEPAPDVFAIAKAIQKGAATETPLGMPCAACGQAVPLKVRRVPPIRHSISISTGLDALLLTTQTSKFATAVAALITGGEDDEPGTTMAAVMVNGATVREGIRRVNLGQAEMWRSAPGRCLRSSLRRASACLASLM